MLTPASAAVVLTLSARGEITVSELQQKEQSATGGEELSSQAVSELPLNKRDFSPLLLLAAGTMTDTNGATNFTRSSPSTGSAAWKRPSPWTAPTSATRRWAARRSRTSMSMRSRASNPAPAGCLPRSAAAPRGSPISLRAPAPAAFTDRSSSLCATPPSTRATILTTPTPAYPGRIPPFRRNEFGFTNGGPVYIPRALRRPQAHLLLHPVPGLPPGAGHHAGDARAHCRRAHRHSTQRHLSRRSVDTLDGARRSRHRGGARALSACPITQPVRSGLTPMRRHRRWSPMPTSSPCASITNSPARTSSSRASTWTT